MSNKDKVAKEKGNYRRMQEIRNKLESGQPTTFQERNTLMIYDKRKAKKN